MGVKNPYLKNFLVILWMEGMLPKINLPLDSRGKPTIGGVILSMIIIVGGKYFASENARGAPPP